MLIHKKPGQILKDQHDLKRIYLESTTCNVMEPFAWIYMGSWCILGGCFSLNRRVVVDTIDSSEIINPVSYTHLTLPTICSV